MTISTIQRLYALLKGEELAPELDEESAYEVEPSKPVEVTTTPAHLIVLGHSPLERIEPFGEFRAVVRAGRVVTVRRVIRARPA